MASVYGEDVSVFYGGTLGLDPTGGLISGERLVLEDCAKRLMTQPGTLKDPSYGYDLLSKVGARVSAVGMARISAHIKEQLKLDQRVFDVPVVTITDGGGGQWTVSIGITLASGDFDLVLGVSNLTMTILRTGRRS